jgi:FKBP-type peptidyl-prolyl cis-trans isomerase FkpA
MQKNKIYITSGLIITVLALGGSSFAYAKKQSANKAAKLRALQGQETSALQPLALQDSSGVNIPLNNTTAPSANTDVNSLRVDSSANTSANIQGQSNNQNQPTPSASAASKLPGPESFGQYEQYKDGKSALFADLIVGTGTEVIASSKVAVYYKGWLTNGQLFDESRTDPATKKLQPFVFTMGERSVIAGWEQSIFGMKVGGSRRLVIPPSVGYGPTGQGSIPGNSVLVFDVQLLALE